MFDIFFLSCRLFLKRLSFLAKTSYNFRCFQYILHPMNLNIKSKLLFYISYFFKYSSMWLEIWHAVKKRFLALKCNNYVKSFAIYTVNIQFICLKNQCDYFSFLPLFEEGFLKLFQLPSLDFQ